MVLGLVQSLMNYHLIFENCYFDTTDFMSVVDQLRPNHRAFTSLRACGEQKTGRCALGES